MIMHTVSRLRRAAHDLRAAHAECTVLALHPQVGAKVGIEEAGLLLDITAGRPDVAQILADTLLEASELGPKTSVGVFIGGNDAPPSDSSWCRKHDMSGDWTLPRSTHKVSRL